MKFKIIFLVFCVCMVVSCKNSPVKTDYTKLKLKGAVKNITETYFLPVLSGDTIKRGEQTTSESTFFESKGEEAFMSYETKIFFNQQGNIMEFTISDPASDLLFKEVYEYTDNILTLKKGTLNGDFFYKEIYQYNTKNKEIERNFYDAENHIFETIITEYPDKNTIVEKVYTPENETSEFERISTFEKDLPTMLVTKLENSVTEKWVAEYDENGYLAGSKLYDENEELIQYTKSKYDEFGNEIEFAMYTPENQLISIYKYQYIYDKNNNWTQQATIINNYPEIITVRDIEYYSE